MLARVIGIGAAAALMLAAAGCGGGSKSPSVASLGAPATTTTGGTAPSGEQAAGKGNPADFAHFVSCMQKHGVQAQVGTGGHGVQITGNADPNSPNFQTAQTACSKYLPGGGPKALTPAQQAQAVQQAVKLAQCMRAHGVPNFPDPGSDGSFSLSRSGNLDPSSSTFQSAMQTCAAANKGKGLRIGIRVHP